MVENKEAGLYEEFAAHIIEETERARAALPVWIDDPEITSVGCVDGLTEKGSVNPPGGLVFLTAERHLERFVRTRSEAGVSEGTLMAHKNCGYIRVVLGEDELQGQAGIIRQAQRYLRQLNNQYRTNFQVLVENQGSAAPYMKR